MKALKGLVAFLGLLLVAGLALLGYGLYSKSHVKGSPAAAMETSATETGTAVFGTVQVSLPAGTRVEQMLGVGDRVVLRLAGGGPDRLLVIDPGRGRVAGAFVLAPEPAGH